MGNEFGQTIRLSVGEAAAPFTDNNDVEELLLKGEIAFDFDGEWGNP